MGAKACPGRARVADLVLLVLLCFQHAPVTADTHPPPGPVCHPAWLARPRGCGNARGRAMRLPWVLLRAPPRGGLPGVMTSRRVVVVGAGIRGPSVAARP